MNTPTNCLKLNQISYHYQQLTAVDRLSLELNPGEILGLLGPNGAGKTTTIQMIAGLLVPHSGSILYQEKSFPELMKKHPDMIGIAPQELIIWPYLTVREQLIFSAQLYGLSRSMAKSRSDEMITALGLQEKYKTQARKLSGGMKRRLNTGLALVHNPDIIILDEPEAGLDPQSRRLVRELIRSLSENKAILFTTHNMDEAERLCHRVAIMDHGRILTSGTPADLTASIGDGDIIEFTTAFQPSITPDSLKVVLGDDFRSTFSLDQKLIIRTLNGARHLPALLQLLENDAITVKDVHFRWNTLEDVFISLTGRSLRQ